MERMNRPKSRSELDAMRQGGAMLATVLKKTGEALQPGISTAALAAIAEAELKRLGGEPAFLGYGGFPDVLCVSLNDAVVHGIPDRAEIIKSGDIVSLDFGVRWQNLITDGARTFIVGKPRSEREQELVTATQAALHAGIAAVRAGRRVGDVSAAVQQVLERHGLGIVRDLVGHGVGDELHEAPNIANFGHAGTGMVLESGMTVAIEPMATLGRETVRVDHDGWTVRTRDGSRSAHFEDTVAVTEKGAIVLTAS
jgi:methionyl aminopeptidase